MVKSVKVHLPFMDLYSTFFLFVTVKYQNMYYSYMQYITEILLNSMVVDK